MTLLAISIITPCFNSARYIEQAIQSVLDQDYQNFEHIIIDGGSTDGTLDILRHYSHLTVFSEPDSGMYDALNKGLKRSSGEIIGLLNSDDLYIPGILPPINTFFTSHPEIDVLAASAEIFQDETNGKKKIFNVFPPVEKEKILQRILEGSPILNAMFFRRAIFSRVGYFDVQFRIAGDVEWMVRLALSEIKELPYHEPIYQYRDHPQSMTFGSDINNWIETQVENRLISERYLHQYLPHENKKQMQLWHTNASNNLIKIHMSKKNWTGILQCILRAWYANPWWPLITLKRLMNSSRRFSSSTN